MKVCDNCFNDLEIKRFIESNTTENGVCDVCDVSSSSKLIDLSELLDFFIELLSIYKEDISGESIVESINENWNLFIDSDVGRKILTKVIDDESLHITDISKKVVYIDDISECIGHWEILKEDLKWNRRYLTNVEDIINYGWDAFFNEQSPLLNTDSFFRARIHQNDGEPIFDANQMGSPDRIYASGGRANPVGIPYLYLSKAFETTLYETRALYLDEVSIGEFKIKSGEEVIVVDFTQEIS